MYEKEKQKLKILIDDFKFNHEQYLQMSEADIETKLVEELFVNILGWNKNDFKKQATAYRGDVRGRADYAFYINDKLVFFLEVKKVNVPLSKEADKQVISYALSKRVPFAVSTNFEEMKVFCVEAETENKRLLKKFISPDAYLEKFNDLWLLSKESFLKELLLKEAISLELLKKRISIDKTLLQDLMYIRKEIASDIEKTYKTKFTIEEKDEIVQRIIDRLIFIRCCEDKGINPEDLRLYDITNEVDNKAYKKLKLMFTKYNEVYNSGLFAPNKDNECDNIELNGGIIKRLVKLLYDSKNGDFTYNFEWIGADILGQVYEQYLGMILAQTKSGNAKLKEGQAHKKEQGIYYTPTYIVEYIVKNTVGELLKDKKVKAKNIKILDPACGSGSFLIQAFDCLNETLSKTEEYKQNKNDSQGMYSLKTDILKNNIYGVDLDNKAVEITKLNLLLKAAEKFRKLPSEVDMHIKHGNSLIDDPQIAGTAAFKWQEQFSDVIDAGGFDVVIGNPPWVSIKGKQKSIDFTEQELENLFKNYPCDTYRPNLFEMFIWRSMSLIKEGGYFGFIVPDRLCYNGQYAKLRKYILENFTIKKLWFKPFFGGVISDNVIFILQKRKPTINSKVEIAEYPSVKFISIPQRIYTESSDYSWFIVDEKLICLFKKIKLNKYIQVLGELFNSNVGFIAKPQKLTNIKNNPNQIAVYKGENILRYSTKKGYFFEFSKKNLAGGTQDIKKLSVANKVFLRKTGNRIIATFDDTGAYPEQSAYIIYSKTNDTAKLKLLCGLLNSKLMNSYYYNFAITNRDATPQLKKIDLDKFPIITKKSDSVVLLVDKMLSLNKQLQSFGDKQTSETAKIEEEIKRTDEKIDQLVYKLYELTPEEIKIVEDSLTK